MDYQELTDRFRFFGVSKWKTESMEKIREATLGLAMLIDEHSTDSREKSLAITSLEEALFWANRGVCRSKENG